MVARLVAPRALSRAAFLAALALAIGCKGETPPAAGEVATSAADVAEAAEARRFDLKIERDAGRFTVRGALHAALASEVEALLDQPGVVDKRVSIESLTPAELEHASHLATLVDAAARLQDCVIEVTASHLSLSGHYRDEATRDAVNAAVGRVARALGLEVRGEALLDGFSHGPDEGFIRTPEGARYPGRLIRFGGTEAATVDAAGRVRAGIYRDEATGLHHGVRAGHVTVVREKAAAIVISGQRFALDEEVRVSVVGEPGALGEPIKGTPEAPVFPLGPDKTPAAGRRAIGPKDILGFGDVLERRDVVAMAVLHASLTNTAEEAQRVNVGRGLSDHFIIDFDGTIHQTLDVAWAAYHAGETNMVSVSINFASQLPNLMREPDASPFRPGHAREAELGAPEHRRPVSEVSEINGAKVRSFGFTEAQYRSLGTLLRTLAGVFPALEAGAPRDPRGEVINRVVDEPLALRGVVAHYHLEAQRWDPGPGMDWDRLGLDATRPAPTGADKAAPEE